MKKILYLILFISTAAVCQPTNPFVSFSLLNPKEAAVRRNVDNDVLNLAGLIRQAQQENKTSITFSPGINYPDALVNYLVSTMKFTVTATPAGAGQQNITNISWADETKMPYTGIPEFAFVAGSNVTTTLQTLQNITGLSIALLPNSTYEYEAVLMATTSAVTTGTGYGINYSAAGATLTGWITGAQSSTVQRPMLVMNSLNTATAGFLTTSAQSGGIHMRGRITTGASAGNLTVQHLKTTSGTSTVLIGSFLKVIKVL